MFISILSKIVSRAKPLAQWNVNKPRQMSRLIAFQHHQTHTVRLGHQTPDSGGSGPARLLVEVEKDKIVNED